MRVVCARIAHRQTHRAATNYHRVQIERSACQIGLDDASSSAERTCCGIPHAGARGAGVRRRRSEIGELLRSLRNEVRVGPDAVLRRMRAVEVR